MTVLQLNERVRSLLNNTDGLRDVWVTGEISNLKAAPSGHYYFTLKDSSSEISCSLFRGARARMSFEPKNNMKVAAFGKVDIYLQRGSYQFIIDTMRSSGIGDLYAAYEELKKKLESEGLFEQSAKKPLPRYPKTIGVVTSPTGAVIHDILNVSSRRFPADILLYPALVQGDGAAATIVKGIETLNKEKVDVIIVGRGGGSIEDLWAFNEEKVARAIFSSEVPIISAVGHETDFTIADLVADVRAPTPSAAAEIALPDKAGEIRGVDVLEMRLGRSLTSKIDSMNQMFRVVDAKLSSRRAVNMVTMLSSEVDNLSIKAASSMRSVMERMERNFMTVDAKLSPRRARDSVDQFMFRLNDLSDTSDSAIKRILNDMRKDIASIDARITGLNPTSVLGRGYSMITDANGRTVTDTSGLSVGSDIRIRMRDGTAAAEIKGVERNE